MRTVRARANRECASGMPIDATVATFSSVTVTCADEGADEEELELVPGRAAESVSTSRSVHVRVLVDTSTSTTSSDFCLWHRRTNELSSEETCAHLRRTYARGAKRRPRPH